MRKKDGFKITFVKGPDLHVPKIVNISGPSNRLYSMPALITSMVESGFITESPFGGVAVDKDLRAIGSTPQRNTSSGSVYYALGPITAGTFPESIAVPPIRDQATHLAHSIVKDIIHAHQKGAGTGITRSSQS